MELHGGLHPLQAATSGNRLFISYSRFHCSTCVGPPPELELCRGVDIPSESEEFEKM